VQFEDDEYYYYVKAVPKMNVSAPEVKVKNINRSRERRPIRPVRGEAATMETAPMDTAEMDTTELDSSYFGDTTELDE
jgi:hypothetical protein